MSFNSGSFYKLPEPCPSKLSVIGKERKKQEQLQPRCMYGSTATKCKCGIMDQSLEQKTEQLGKAQEI